MKYIYVLSLLCFITAADAAVVERPATRARLVGLPTGTGLGVKNLGAGGSATNLTALNQNVGANSNFVTNSSVEKFTTNTTTGKNKEDSTGKNKEDSAGENKEDSAGENKEDSAGENKEDSVTEDAVENSETCVLPQIKNTDGKCVDAQVLSLDDLMYGMNAKSKENAKVATDYCWGKFYKDDYSLCVLGYKVSVVSANVVNAETTKIDNKFNQKDDLETALSTPMAKLDDTLMVATTKSDTSSNSEDSSAGAGTESADTSSKSSNSGSDTNSSAYDKAIETLSGMMDNTAAKGFSASSVMGGTSSSNSTSGSSTTSTSGASNTTVVNNAIDKIQNAFGGSVGGFKWK